MSRSARVLDLSLEHRIGRRDIQTSRVRQRFEPLIVTERSVTKEIGRKLDTMRPTRLVGNPAEDCQRDDDHADDSHY